jgi:hypothetical protein
VLTVVFWHGSCCNTDHESTIVITYLTTLYEVISRSRFSNEASSVMSIKSLKTLYVVKSVISEKMINCILRLLAFQLFKFLTLRLCYRTLSFVYALLKKD